MFKSERPWNVAAVAILLSLAAAHSAAGSGSLQKTSRFEENSALKLSRDSVLKGDSFLIGDLEPVSPAEADALAARTSAVASQWPRCLETGPVWLRESEDGGGLYLVPPWGSPEKDRIVTAQCNEKQIHIGGHSYLRGRGESVVQRAMLFLAEPGRDGPVKIVFTKAFSADGVLLELNEIRAIDPASGQILFSATEQNGTRVLVAAPYAALEVEEPTLGKPGAVHDAAPQRIGAGSLADMMRSR